MRLNVKSFSMWIRPARRLPNNGDGRVSRSESQGRRLVFIPRGGPLMAVEELKSMPQSVIREMVILPESIRSTAAPRFY